MWPGTATGLLSSAKADGSSSFLHDGRDKNTAAAGCARAEQEKTRARWRASGKSLRNKLPAAILRKLKEPDGIPGVIE